MRIEYIPIIIGALIALVGVGLLFDAWTPDEIIVKRERRRKPRAERHRAGEALVGIGVIAMAASFLGRDTWRYSTIVVVAGTVALLAGSWLNRSYLRELFTNRGPLRRRPPAGGASAGDNVERPQERRRAGRR